jgi:hypothetical protein
LLSFNHFTKPVAIQHPLLRKTAEPSVPVQNSLGTQLIRRISNIERTSERPNGRQIKKETGMVSHSGFCGERGSLPT